MKRQVIVSDIGAGRAFGARLPSPALVQCATLLTLCANVSTRAEAHCHYTWVRIPNPGAGTHCVGTCINNLGTVAGYIVSGGDTTTAFVWSAEMGRVHLPFPAGYISMRANGINDLGHVAGDMWGPAGRAGFIWDGENHTLIYPPVWANWIEVYGINNQNQIVGMINNSSTGPMHAFIWEFGALADIGSPQKKGHAVAASINERGTVVGTARWGPPLTSGAFTFDNGFFSWLETPDDVDSTSGQFLNNNAVVVGHATVNQPIHAEGVVWTPWSLHVIPPATESRDAYVTGVNDQGRAVGYYYRGATDRPFIWQNGVVRELRPLVVPELPFLRYAHAINRLGQIVAEENRGTVLLNPVWLSGDLTGDCHVSIEDLVLLLSDFGSPAGNFPPGDVDGNGSVELADLSLLLAHWGD